MKKKQDPTLCNGMEFIQANSWSALEYEDDFPAAIDIRELDALYKLRDELTVSLETDILLRGS